MSNADPSGDDATLFIEWVYSNPGKAPEDYASELAKRMNKAVLAEREACAKIADDARMKFEDVDVEGAAGIYASSTIAELIRKRP